MNVQHYVGTPAVRLLAAAAATVSVGLALLAARGVPYAFEAALGTGAIALMALLHAFRSVFSAWMRFAEGLQLVVVTTVFSICYLLLVPLFALAVWVRDPLRLRGRNRSSWVHRSPDVDAASLERMG